MQYMTQLEQVEKETHARFTDIFDTFLTLSACALAQGRREEAYLNALEPYKPQAKLFQQAFANLINEMQEKPYTDLLGDTHQSLGSEKDKVARGEFYTPPEICKFMASAVMPDAPEERPLTVHEPTAGSGRMILALADRLANVFKLGPTILRVEAWDISLPAVHMTYINTTLWGIPCEVVHGNTLSMEVFDVWPNLFIRMYPFPRREDSATEGETTVEAEGRKENVPKRLEPVLTLGKGSEQPSLFDTNETDS